MNQQQLQQQLQMLNDTQHDNNIIQYIYNERHVFGELELDDEVLLVETYEKILKVLCSLTFVRSVIVRESFLASLNENKIRIVLEIIGRLPKLQSLTIEFPNEIIQANGSTSEKISCHPDLLCSALRKGKHSKLRKLNVRGLTFTTTKVTATATTAVDDGSNNSSREADSDSLFVDGSMKAYELSTRICQCKELRSITLLDLQICHQSDLSSFFYCISNNSANGGEVELPHLESIEIRLMNREKFHITGKKNNYETFFYDLLTNNTLKSLILWNMILNDRQTKQLCDALSCCDNSNSKDETAVTAVNKSRRKKLEKRPSLQSITGTEEQYPCCNIQQLELWRCDLGSNFGSLLKEVFATNTTIKDLTLSYVPLHVVDYFDDDDDHRHHNDENYLSAGTGYSNGNSTGNNGNRVVATLMNILKESKKSNIENIKFFGNNVSVCHYMNIAESNGSHNSDTCSSVKSRIGGTRNSIKDTTTTTNTKNKVFSKEAMDAMKDSSSLKSISFHYGNSDEIGSNDECIVLDKLLRLKKSLKQQKQKKKKGVHNGYIRCILTFFGHRCTWSSKRNARYGQ